MIARCLFWPTVSCLSGLLVAVLMCPSAVAFSGESVRCSAASAFVNNNEHIRQQATRPRHSRRRENTRRRARRDESSGYDAGREPSKSKDDDEENTSQKFTLAEIAQKEEAASRRVMNRLMLPDKIGKVINFAAWFFVISSIALESMGYGYVPREGGGLTIDTLENKAFVMEVRRSSHHQ